MNKYKIITQSKDNKKLTLELLNNIDLLNVQQEFIKKNYYIVSTYFNDNKTYIIVYKWEKL